MEPFKVREARRLGDVDYLLGALSDSIEAPFAARYLGELGAHQAEPALRQLLRADDLHVRAAAATALGELRAADSLPELADLAKTDPVPWVRAWAVAAVAHAAEIETTRPVLVAALRDRDPRVRRAAAVNLGEKGTGADVAILRDARRSEPLWRRGVYLKAAGRIELRASSVEAALVEPHTAPEAPQARRDRLAGDPP